MERQLKAVLTFIAVFAMLVSYGCSTTSNIAKHDVVVEKEVVLNNNNSQNNNTPALFFNPDTVKAGKYDIGTMWTFDFPPVEYFSKTYGFNPTKEWFEKTRLSALRFATYCSASFVSEDGLVMTNDHCSRDNITAVSKPGENLQDNGFYAKSLEEERKVDGLFVDQLILIQDVTKEMQDSIAKGITDKDKADITKRVTDLIVKREKKDNSLDYAQVVTLYNGGKYSLYGYKRYNDVRLVLSPETQMAFYGGDNDNFTYPRYDVDFTFYRVYDKDGKPLKTPNYFKWSKNGAAPEEPVFVVGNPGSTMRLQTVAQLEFTRDIAYPRTLELLNGLMTSYTKLINSAKSDKEKEEYRNEYFSFSNSFKAIDGQLKGLRDSYLMARKKAWENDFKAAVNKNPELQKMYGDLWDKIASGRKELSTYSNEAFALQYKNRLLSSEYFLIAQDLVDLAKKLNAPEDQKSPELKGDALKATIESLFPEDLNTNLENDKLALQADRINSCMGNNNPLAKNFTNGKSGVNAVSDILSRSSITTKAGVIALANKGSKAILASDDPFIRFILDGESRRQELAKKTGEISARETVYTQALGKALFEVYGTSIPPDATFTLRISDGVVRGFPYNGTVAPPITTFFGLYDKYNSYGKQGDYDISPRWKTPPAGFDLSTPMNFVSTNDIIGGNSGSPIINKNREIVGLAFDGNIQSLPGSFIFTTDENRTVGVHSAGLLEVVKNLYKAKRVAEELQAGKIVK